MSVSVHIQNNIADFVKDVIQRIFPNGGEIFDPTCGNQNRQFKKYFTGSEKYLNNFSYKGTDLIYGFDVFKEKSLAPAFDIVWYDPPFTPKPTFDKRSSDYGNQDVTIQKIKDYFSIPVIENLMTFTKKYLAVRGMDFYYPINSLNFYSFYDLCMKDILRKTELNLYCLYIMPYTRADIETLIKINKRPVINYSYTAVFMKGNFE